MHTSNVSHVNVSIRMKNSSTNFQTANQFAALLHCTHTHTLTIAPAHIKLLGKIKQRETHKQVIINSSQ